MNPRRHQNEQRLLVLLIYGLLSVAPAAAQDVPSIQVTFSPEGGATESVVKLIRGARSSIRLAAYSFTSKTIAGALADAQKRGIDVRAVLDQSNETDRFTAAIYLTEAAIPTRVDRRYAAMHNKFLVIDGRDVETGSFNYTRAAEEHNAENVMILRGYPQIASEYQERWQLLWDESDAYRQSR